MNKKTQVIFLVSLILVIFDQVSKFAIYDYFKVEHPNPHYYLVTSPNKEIRVISEIVKFVYVENAGLAFGIQVGALKIFLSIFSILASVVLVFVLLKIKDYPFAVQLAFGSVLAGAVGNLIDRVFYGVIFGYAPIFYGRVIDFIQVDIPDINIGGIINYTHWPVFNIADSCVTIGIILLLILHKQLPNLGYLFAKKNIPPSS
ncbi:MAG: signal peptidase II [Ignavibacteria bacterium]|nr:signal peptidase II [Ignavibacteria bacterium]